MSFLVHYIGEVDKNSPAEKAGLLEGDVVIEVNGVNVAQENHNDVVKRIKAGEDETKLILTFLWSFKFHLKKQSGFLRLLVVDKAAYKFFLELGLSEDIANVSKASSLGLDIPTKHEQHCIRIMGQEEEASLQTKVEEDKHKDVKFPQKSSLPKVVFYGL